MELTQEFGPEIMTLSLSLIGISSINKGSSAYGKLNNKNLTVDEIGEIKKDASGKILFGGTAMSITALAAGNPIFAIPQISIVIGALKPYLEAQSPGIEAFFKKIHASILVKLSALGAGAFTLSEFVNSPTEALPPLGLAGLAIAFSGIQREKVYRALTMSGGSTLAVGSFISSIQSFGDGNNVGGIMSASFALLNILFTTNEIREVIKMIKRKKVKLKKD